MPSLSSLLKRWERAMEQQQEHPNHLDKDGVTENGTNEKVQRRLSKRDFFRNLLFRNPPRSDSRTSGKHSFQVTQDTHPSSQDKPVSPMSNPNKPLPAPPPPIVDETVPPAKSPTKLNRIISPLSLPEIHKLFSGAPQFFVRSEGHYTGPPKPSTAFPWNTEVYIRDLCDHYQNEDQAWASVTAYPHITRDLDKNKEAISARTEKQRAHFIPRCHERPNMLSLQGIERGTVGFSAALEMGVADALYEGTETPASPGMGSLSERRNNFLNVKKHGVRPLTEPDVVTKLIELGELYNEFSSFDGKSSVELYTQIFTQVLFPPTRVTDSNDPYSLHVQIEALIDVLASPNIWIDFSLVEWRIRLGQILWGPPYEPEAGDVTINGEVHEPGTQKFWLLLQILLSCELLIRLDIVTKKAEHDPNAITADEARRFEEDATQSVRWSMILARTWLENIRVENALPAANPQEKKPVAGWLATLIGTEPVASNDADAGTMSSTNFQSRHQARQINGLVHFARKLHWPEVDNVALKFSQSAATISESTSSIPAVGTPLSMTTQRSPYFGNLARPALRRGLSRQQQRGPAMMQPSGWLSRSYLAGLILPGEGLSHLLISTLLENDEVAIARLGDEANLYGGFLYSSKSYWSTACIVGRVLAAGKGSSECMGWLSSDVLPKGMGDGWVNIEVEGAPHDEGGNSPATARIWKKQIIEREGHVLGDGDASTILSGDFTVPIHDIKDTENLEVKLLSLELFAAVESVRDMPIDDIATQMSATDATETGKIRTYSATMTFAVSLAGGDSRDITFDLSYDVHFVTAHPCVPSAHTSILDSPTSPSFHMSSPLLRPGNSKLGPHELYGGHPLHKYFAYKREVLSHILNPLPSSSVSDNLPLASLHTSSQEVFVIDCTEPNPPSESTTDTHPTSMSTMARKRRWGSDLEMLARAWCAEKGYNALISRRGRNCIACSIREARALGWKIVLRFG